ncbi:hypothetical protein HGRIS_002105 [Hohenbuehelia grisea]|uniref:Phosphomevalonate kinase n=1 Tax=Hohenbuehelia grisea TaxID=104357 RepID=A0ABR3JJX8_9AGAR
MNSTVVSSPGKVLVAGGYLILDPAFSGVVVSTSSRFYTVVQPRTTAQPNTIQVRSPQFANATWNYSVSLDGERAVNALPENASQNKFVHLALKSAISLAAELKGVSAVSATLASGLDIGIVGDNDFYSQRAKLASLNLPRTLQSLSQIPPFCPTDGSLSNVHKTGLGSSAALITSLVSALLVHLEVIPKAAFAETEIPTEGRLLAHNLAQYVHCLAQGKVGSGFDVAAAVFGSHLYTRFSPAVLEALMNDDSASTTSLLPTVSPSNPGWDYRIEPFVLPPLVRIMLADVDAGSDTPSLVGKVLQWRKQDPDRARGLWTAIDQENQSLASNFAHLTKLHDKDPEVYGAAVKYLSTLQPVQWLANPWTPPEEVDITAAFFEAHRITQSIRTKMREMGELSGVPIEPTEQTDLLDACMSQAGVIGGGVPGAGGYDAVWLLLCDPVDCSPDQRPTERVERLWGEYSKLNVSPLSAIQSKERGTRIENLDEVPGLQAALST